LKAQGCSISNTGRLDWSLTSH